MYSSQTKFVLTFAAILALTILGNNEAGAQGFRIGNVMQAGGGQGFRLGGPRMGMHFGGGQGASIGGQNYGMRFGNGQGARFGGRYYGMQFGGGQGTQIGRFQSQPNVTPGTYYYGGAQPQGNRFARISPQPRYLGPSSRPTLAQPRLQTPSGGLISATSTRRPTLAAPATNPNASVQNSTNSNRLSDLNGMIRLSHPEDAPGDFAYRLNGTDFTLAPGNSVYMASGQEWNLEFSAGEGFGDREATLSDSGDFVFSKSDDEGWILLRNQTSPAETQTKLTDAEQTDGQPTPASGRE